MKNQFCHIKLRNKLEEQYKENDFIDWSHKIDSHLKEKNCIL